jgi:hypothetical protein
MVLEIDEVLGRSEQGITQPYICRASDGRIYYVKGKGAAYQSLVKEWIVGQLAQRLKLPMPPFAILDVPRALFELRGNDSLRDLGSGLVFGSRQLENVNEITITNVVTLSPELKRDIAAFDWWVMNGDRTLSEAGGNPNVLWSGSERRPYIIDHNLAFDEQVTLPSLISTHIFGNALDEICRDPDLQEEYRLRFDGAVSDLSEILGDVPERWHYLDDALTVETDFSTEHAEALLRRYDTQLFWQR